MMPMKKKRVLFLVESLAGGGAEKVLSTIVEHLDHCLFDITVCSIVRTGVYVDEVGKHSTLVSVIENSKSLAGRIKYKMIYHLLPPRLIYRLFIPKGHDIEIAFLEGIATRIISGSSNVGSRKIAWVHTDLLNNHWTDIAYKDMSEEHSAYRQFDDIVCVSETVKASIDALYPGLDNLTVLYNPVDGDRILRLAKEALKSDLFHRGSPTLISIGRLVPQKGYQRLLPILKRLHDEGFGFVMNILGEGPERHALERIISDNDMDGYVRLPGFVSNPYPYLNSSDLFVCSSRSEGYSTAVTEALILGIPVLTTECSGMRELLDGGRYGLMVENNDEAIYQGIYSFLSDSRLFSMYRSNAKEFANRYSVNSIIKRIEGFLAS